MPAFIHRQRNELCTYLSPAEKLKRYTSWIYPTPDELNRPYGLIELGLSLGTKNLVIVPDNFSITGDRTPRQFNRFGSRLWLPKKESDFIKEVKTVLNNVRTSYTPRGLTWEMNGVTAVYLYACMVDGHVFYEAFEGDMASELFQFQGLSREVIKVSPNYRQNNIVCEVPSRSMVDARHFMTMFNPPTYNSQYDWRHVVIKHQCGDVIYNLELNVGEEETALEEHDLAGCRAAGKVSAQRGEEFKTNLILPITREFARLCGIVINRFVKIDTSLSGDKVRNLKEGERNRLFGDYIRFKQDELGFRAADSLILDNLGEFEQELKKDNYILEILYPS